MKISVLIKDSKDYKSISKAIDEAKYEGKKIKIYVGGLKIGGKEGFISYDEMIKAINNNKNLNEKQKMYLIGIINVKKQEKILKENEIIIDLLKTNYQLSDDDITIINSEAGTTFKVKNLKIQSLERKLTKLFRLSKDGTLYHTKAGKEEVFLIQDHRNPKNSTYIP